MASESQPRGVALYDMDGTLLAWDCQLLFRHHVLRAEPWRLFSVPVFLICLPLAKLLGTEGMKRVFHCFLWKISPSQLKEYSVEFAQSLRDTLYPELLETIYKHKAAGDFLILSSASPECYVREVGAMLGFDLSLGTVLENHQFFPDLTNHKGSEKVLRLHKCLPGEFFSGVKLFRSHGYSDSAADLPMLAICECVTVVNPNAQLSSMAREKKWQILRPTKAWKSPLDKAIRVIALLLAVGKNPAKL